ncbi:MAG TPA: HEAT repeat domain-containing protein [Polyangia bacterium]|jgi:TonB family protein|nr:HEAT repeat domain-containing protein [Polyangia bacterium]
MPVRRSSNHLFAAAFVLAILMTAATAFGAPLDADKLEEPALAGTGIEHEYLRLLHERVHPRWAGNFLRLAAGTLPISDQVNDPARTASVDLVLGADGQIISIEVSKGSGFAGFDDAAREVLRDSVPFPSAAADVRSDDGQVHLRWIFARDQRRCSQVTVIHTEEPLAVAIPKLVRAGRGPEALRRLRVAREGGAALEAHLTALATPWLKATIDLPHATVEVADMLATLGDPAGVKWLKNAVKRPELASAAGRALAAHHEPVCPIVRGLFGSEGKPAAGLPEQHSAALALATAGEADCAPGLIALLTNPKARVDARVAATVALGAITTSDEARKALAEAIKEGSGPAALRAAALLAGTRPGSGRSRVFALVGPLRDPSPELRAAAAAGIVRAGGNSNLDDLYVIFKDSDPRPATAVALELDRLRTPEATALLVRLLKRPHVSVQLAAAHALIDRGARDTFAALKPFLDARGDADLRGLALVSAEASTLDNLAKVVAASERSDAKITRLVLTTYHARLARGERGPAADLLVGALGKLSPADQANALVDWLAANASLNAAAATPSTTAAAVPVKR